MNIQTLIILLTIFTKYAPKATISNERDGIKIYYNGPLFLEPMSEFDAALLGSNPSVQLYDGYAEIALGRT